MKLVSYILLILTLAVVVHPISAQDENDLFRVSIDECNPRFWLPDNDAYVIEFDRPAYDNEQLVELCVTIRDQSEAIQQNPQINAAVVSAVSSGGMPIEVLETYAPRLPEEFTYEIVLLLDTSESMSNSMSQLQQAARSAVRNSTIRNAYYAIYEFNNTASSRQPLTNNRDLIEAAIDEVRAQQGTSTCLYDAVRTALQAPPAEEWARRVIILFTDGRNSDQQGLCEQTSDEDVIEEANRRGVSVFAIGLTGNTGVDQEQLNRLTQQTNGAAVYGDRNQLPGLFEEILRNLNSMRVVRTLICGTGTVVLTLQLNVNDQPAEPDSTVVQLGNTQCAAPTPEPEIEPTEMPSLPDLNINLESFDIAPDANAQDIATFIMRLTDRPDIGSVRAQIIDSASVSAPRSPQECTTIDALNYQCEIDVTALAAGQLTVQVTVLDPSGNSILDQPFTNSRQKTDVQPQLQAQASDGVLNISVIYPISVTSATFSFREPLPSGRALPFSQTFSVVGPYSLPLDSIDADTVIVEAQLTYGTNIRTAISEPVTLQRSLAQQVSRFLRMNGLIIGAVIVMVALGIGWFTWQKRRSPQSREEDWLRAPIPDSTKLVNRPETPQPIKLEQATRIYDVKPPLGVLQIVRLTTDSAKEGSQVTVSVPFTIGRSASCQLVINDDYLSRTHLTITQKDGKAYIRDMGSSNGTVLNGQPLSPNEDVLLTNGADIALGQGILLRFKTSVEQSTRVIQGPGQR